MNSLKNFRHGDVKIVCDAFSYEKKPEIRDFIGSPEVNRIREAVGQRFILVLGGDGTMLRAIHAYYQENLPFLGVNYGTKGFLLNERAWLASPESFMTRAYPILEVEVERGSDTHRAVAFNEVQIKSASGRSVDLDFRIADRVTQNVQGDGLLVVTPAGSTGYNRSAGGHIYPHNLGVGVITPLNPWKPLHMRPIPYNRADPVSIRNRTDRPSKLSIYADSVEVLENVADPVSILIRESSTHVRLLIASEHLGEWDAKTFAEQGMEIL